MHMPILCQRGTVAMTCGIMCSVFSICVGNLDLNILDFVLLVFCSKFWLYLHVYNVLCI